MAGAAAPQITADLAAMLMLVLARVVVATVVVTLLLPLPSLSPPMANVREPRAPLALAQLLETAAVSTDGAAVRQIIVARDVIVASAAALEVLILFPSPG